MTMKMKWLNEKFAEKRRSTDSISDVYFDINLDADEKSTPSWSWSDIDVGDILGEGTFASVFVVKPNFSSDKIHLYRRQRQQSTSSSCAWYHPGSTSSDLSTSSCHSNNKNWSYTNLTQKFAMKKLNNAIMEDPEASFHAIEGIKFEAEILMGLPLHPNIITLEGLSDNFYEDPASGFLILELLHETLDERLRRWRNHSYLCRKRHGMIEKARHLFEKKDHQEQRARLASIGLSIASAMAFLHHHQIAFRDLKPSNVGFTSEGEVRLFDFGLARHVDHGDRRLTPYVGTFRYMSPECMTGREYGLESDVYSFSIVLWEIITLDKAYSRVRTPLQLRNMTCTGKARPNIQKVVDKETRKLLQACWNPNTKLRPTFATIHEGLRCQTTTKAK